MRILKKIVSLVASELETSGSAEGGSQDMLLQPHTQVSQDIQQAVFTYLDSELSGDSRRDTEFKSRIKETLFNVSSKIPIEQLKEVLKATVACYALERELPEGILQTILDRFYAREDQVSEASKLDRTPPTETPFSPTSSPISPTKKLLINADHDVKIPGSWVSREVDERKLVEHLTHDGTQVIELSMMGGSGKSTCIRNLIDELDKTYGVRYEQVIWYAFYHLRSQDVLTPLKAFLDFVIERAGLRQGRTTEDKKEIVMDYLQRHKVLVVLDGLEIAQKGGRTDDERIIPVKAGEEGEFKDPGFRDFMLEITKQRCSEVIVTTRLPMKEMRCETGELMRGVEQVGLSEWGDDEVKEYLGGVSQEENISEIIRVLGKHPLTMAVFKGMLRKKPEMDVRKFLGLTEKMINRKRHAQRETYVRQCQRIQRMIKELKQVLSEEEKYFMEQVGLMYGSIDYEDRTIVELEEVKGMDDEEIEIWWMDRISNLEGLGLIKPDEKKERIAAHPMVKVGFRALMEGDEKIRKRGEIMGYYEEKSKGRRQGTPLDMDGMMEWGHQLTKIIDEEKRDGIGLDELYQRYKVEMRQLEYSELGRKIKGKMGELITERRNTSIEEEGKGVAVKDDPERETMQAFEEERGGGEVVEAEEEMGVRAEGDGSERRAEMERSRSYEEEKRRRIEELKVKAEGIRGRLSGADMKDTSKWGEIYKLCLEGREIIREMAEEDLQSEVSRLEREMERIVGYSVYVRTLYRTEGEQVAERVRGLMGEQFTGIEEWEEIFGEEPEGIPELPEELVDRLERECPFDGSRKVYETHILYCVPGKLRGKELNIVEWERVMREGEHKGMKGGKLYDNVWYEDERFAKEGISGTEGDERGEWVLMPKFMVPGSTNKGWEGQERMVRDNYGAQGYEVVRALEVVSGIMVNCLRTGERLYGEGYKVKMKDGGEFYPYVNTKDRTSAGLCVRVGDFDGSGLYVSLWAGYPIVRLGVAVCCRFVGHKK